MKLHSPNPTFTGVVAGVVFNDGVGDAEFPKGSLTKRYFERQGYGMGKPVPAPTPAKEPSVEALEEQANRSARNRLRDAAVDPHPDDFLPPVNAGKADPHGPHVVAPEIHHEGPAGLRTGPVAVDDPPRQSREESELAEKVLIEGQNKNELLGTFGPGADTGDLGLSDPASVEAGREGAADAAAARAAGAPAALPSEAPARNASQAEWADWAIAQGMEPDDARDATRKDLIERYGGES